MYSIGSTYNIILHNSNDMKILVTLTWSKIMAFLVLGSALFLDIKNGGATAFMFALPFVVFLITGKQYLDSKNGKDVKTP